MSKIDEAMLAINDCENITQRALNLAGLISTLFKIRGVILSVSGSLAYGAYVNATFDQAEVELAVVSGNLNPRLLQEIMSGQLGAQGMLKRWNLLDLFVQFTGPITSPNPTLCRDFQTDFGVVKLAPAEDLTAERLVAATFPTPNEEAYQEAFYLLKNGLANEFKMDWEILQKLCGNPDYRVSEALAQIRQDAKQQLNEEGNLDDQIGQVGTPAATQTEE